MREIIFKELTSLKARKKNIFFKEIFEKDGVIAKTQRRSFYFIKEIKAITAGQELKDWLNSQSAGRPLNKRQFHIFKERNDELGEDKVICKILGTFYAIVNKKIYTIAFMSYFKACVMRATLAK